MIKSKCTACGHEFVFPPDKEGKRLKCTSCGQMFKVENLGEVEGFKGEKPSKKDKKKKKVPEQKPSQPAPKPAAGKDAGPGTGTVAPRTKTPEAEQAAEVRRHSPLVFVIGIVVILCGHAYLGYLIFTAAPLPPTFMAMIPSETAFIAYTDMGSLRESKLYDKGMAILEGQAGMGAEGFLKKMIPGIAIKTEDVDEMMIAGKGFETTAVDGICGLRFNRKIAFEELVGTEDVTTKKYEKWEYIEVNTAPALYIARVDENGFCIAGDLDRLKAALDRMEKDAPAELSESLALVMKEITGGHLFVAGSVGNLPGRPAGMSMPVKAFGVSVSVNGSVSVGGLAVFAEEKQAAEMQKGIENGVSAGKANLKVPPDADDETKDMIEKTRGLIEALEVESDGAIVRISWRADTDELLEMMDTGGAMFKSMIPRGGVPGLPPAPGGPGGAR